MTMSSDNKPTENIREVVVAPFRPIHSIWLMLLAAGGAGVTVAFLSKDWCFTAFGSAILSAVFIALSNNILLRSAAEHFRWGRILQLLVVVAIVAVLGWAFRIDEPQVFKRAFGIVPPRGVHSLTVDYNLTALPPGDKIILLRFIADQETIDELVSARQFVHEDEPVQLWLKSEITWDRFWERCFSNFSQSGGQGWTNVSPMNQPVFYRWEDPERLLERTSLLWDAETGKAYMLYTLG